MGKILKIENIEKLKSAKNENQTMVVVGGCFDVLHAAHIEFLKKSKKLGNLLVILLESDERIKKIKGTGRPVNSQENRAAILANFSFTDYILPLPNFTKNEDYEILVKKLEPDIIAVSAGSKIFEWEKDYVNRTGAKIIEVMKRVESKSTTKIINLAQL